MGFLDNLGSFLKGAEAVLRIADEAARGISGFFEDQRLLDLYRRDILLESNEAAIGIAAAQQSLCLPSLVFLPLVEAHSKCRAIIAGFSETDSYDDRIHKVAQMLSLLPLSSFWACISEFTEPSLTETVKAIVTERTARLACWVSPPNLTIGQLKKELVRSRKQVADELILKIQGEATKTVSAIRALEAADLELARRLSSNRHLRVDSVRGMDAGAILGSLLGGALGGLVGAFAGLLSDGQAEDRARELVLNQVWEHFCHVDRVYGVVMVASQMISAHIFDHLRQVLYLEDCFLDQVQPYLTQDDSLAFSSLAFLSLKATSEGFLGKAAYPGGPMIKHVLTRHYAEFRRLGIDGVWKYILDQLPPPSPTPVGSGEPRGQGTSAPMGGMSIEEACALLELSPPLDRTRVQRAYHDRARALHPDSIQHLGLDPAFKKFAEEQFRRITEAKDLLLKECVS